MIDRLWDAVVVIALTGIAWAIFQYLRRNFWEI